METIKSTIIRLSNAGSHYGLHLWLGQDGFIYASTEEIASENTQNEPPWGLDRVDQRNLPLDDVYNYDATGDGVTIFIADSGVRSTHQEFSGRFSGCTDFTGEGCDRPGRHGTHVGM